MKEKLQSIREQALSKIAEAQDINLLNDIKVSILGKKGELTQVLKSMKDVAPEDRPKVGRSKARGEDEIHQFCSARGEDEA